MTKKYCFYCEEYNPGRINPDGSNTPRKCAAAHDDVFNKWWQDNGKKKPADTDVYEMECFAPDKMGCLLSDLSESLQKLKDVLNVKD